MHYVATGSKAAKPGDTFGRLTVKGIFRKAGQYPKFGLVSCSCGSPEFYVRIDVMKSGQSSSCGCVHKQAVTKHGLHGNPLYHVWRNMMSRCYNRKDKRYDRYGSRGITVCARWHDPILFVADVEPSYVPGLTIDRIDNDKGYSPDNFRWANAVQQRRNRNDLLMLEYDGIAMCLQDWSTKLGINYGTLWDRHKQGWPTERMLTTPARKQLKTK